MLKFVFQNRILKNAFDCSLCVLSVYVCGIRYLNPTEGHPHPKSHRLVNRSGDCAERGNDRERDFGLWTQCVDTALCAALSLIII